MGQAIQSITKVKTNIPIYQNLHPSYFEKWQKQFVIPKRTFLEGLWRRTQMQVNANDSEWKNETDCRRRMIHYYDQYDLVPNEVGTYDFVVTNPWIWISLSFPKAEIDEYLKQIESGAIAGGWARNQVTSELTAFTLNNTFQVDVKKVKNYKEDENENRKFPPGYEHLEIELHLVGKVQTKDLKNHAWEVLKSGVRTKDKRGNPKQITDLREIEKYLPMQIELGCGPSIEAGNPPLHYLHQVYYVSNPSSHKFVFGANNDKLLFDILSDLEGFYKKASYPLLKSLEAKPSPFINLIKSLYDKNLVVGKVITNNFDGLCNLVGLPETYVRRYDEVHITPKIDFHPDAKMLLVVGAHADRRRIQKSAREKGLKVMYVDPEGFYAKDGKFVSYPTEAPQDTDFIFKGTAAEFATAWKQSFSAKLT